MLKLPTLTPRQGGLLLVALVVVVNLATMPKQRMTGDAMVPRTIARALVFHGQLSVHPAQRVNPAQMRGHFVRNPESGRWYSKWGLANTMLFVAPTVFYAALKGKTGHSNNTLYLLCLNGFNIVLAALIALLLFAIAGFYCRRVGLRVGFVLAALYGSYLWYYLRAQSIDVFQLALFLGYTLCFLRFRYAEREAQLSRRLLVTALLLGILLLARTAFVLLAPALALATFLSLRERGFAPRRMLALALPALVALVAAVGAVAALNQLKFGSMLATGYHQQPEVAKLPMLDRNLLTGLWLYVFDIQRGILVAFPLAIAGLVALPGFWRQRRPDAVFVVAHLVPYALLLAAVAQVWNGEWAYGPRLLLFCVPLLALPLLPHGERAFDTIRHKVAVYAMIAVVAFSLIYQLKVIAMPFHAYYQIYGVFQRYNNHPRSWYRIEQYFNRAHFGEIYGNVVDFARGARTHKALELIRFYSPAQVRPIQRELDQLLKINFYFL